MWDERLTTVSAEKALMESGVRRENRKAVIDQIAAVFILQGYLDCQAIALSPTVLFIFLGSPTTIFSTSFSSIIASILAYVFLSLFSSFLVIVSTG